MAIVILKEGSEIITYIKGFLNAHEPFLAVLSGSVSGLIIGLIIGVFSYQLLTNHTKVDTLHFIFIALIVVSGRMVSQTIQSLIQADIVPGYSFIWDSSNLINEQSLLGQLLFAVMGYEANPTVLQAIFYIIGLCITNKVRS